MSGRELNNRIEYMVTCTSLVSLRSYRIRRRDCIANQRLISYGDSTRKSQTANRKTGLQAASRSVVSRIMVDCPRRMRGSLRISEHEWFMQNLHKTSWFGE